MSKSVAFGSKDEHNTPKTGKKRGGEDEGNEDGEGIIDLPPAAEITTISTTVSAAPAVVDAFMHTPEFKRHFIDFVPVDALMSLRLATKAWRVVAEAFIDENVESGAMIVHDGKDLSWNAAEAREARRKLVTRVIFLLNITKVGDYACFWAINLVVVDIPEGVQRIGDRAFHSCRNLTTVSFPRSE